MLPVGQRYGMGAMAWSPLAMGMLTGRYRHGQRTDSRRTKINPRYMSDAGKLDAVEQLIVVAEAAGLSLRHMAMAFVIAHPGVTAAKLGPRTMDQLGDLFAGMEVVLNDEVLDQINRIVPPGTDVGPLHAPTMPPALTHATLRRRPAAERAAA